MNAASSIRQRYTWPNCLIKVLFLAFTSFLFYFIFPFTWEPSCNNVIFIVCFLLGKMHFEMSPSPENEESYCNGKEQDQTALSMAEIASCSYEARYYNI